MNEVLIIGSGFSSLASACFLAKAGYNVRVLEKNKVPGGRARRLSEAGFSFDMGPSWYWMPDVFDEFFAAFGKKTSDYYTLERLDPSYRIWFGKNQLVDVPTDRASQIALFESLEPGSGAKLLKFLQLAEKTYRIALGKMVYKPGFSPLELVSPDTALNAGLFIRSIRSLIRKNFKHPYLVQLLEFPVLFLGAKPEDTPAFYNFMNHADLNLGTWYPKGGMYLVVEAMIRLALELGVKFETDIEVQKIIVEGNRVTGVETNREKRNCSILVSGADYHHTETLLAPEQRNYAESYWEKKTFAPSALLYYLGLNRSIKGLLHHTLFFDHSFDEHAVSIYDKPRWPAQPLFYTSTTSISDPTVAPPGHENLVILVPLAAGLDDNSILRELCFQNIMRRMENILGTGVEKHIVYKRSYCVNDFISDYNSYKGNAYGLANTLRQTAFMRPSLRSSKIPNLFFTGQLTVPGPGVPPAIISGTIVANQVIKNYPIYEKSTI